MFCIFPSGLILFTIHSIFSFFILIPVSFTCLLSAYQPFLYPQIFHSSCHVAPRVSRTVRGLRLQRICIAVLILPPCSSFFETAFARDGTVNQEQLRDMNQFVVPVEFLDDNTIIEEEGGKDVDVEEDGKDEEVAPPSPCPSTQPRQTATRPQAAPAPLPPPTQATAVAGPSTQSFTFVWSLNAPDDHVASPSPALGGHIPASHLTTAAITGAMATMSLPGLPSPPQHGDIA